MSIEINDWRGNAMRPGVTVTWPKDQSGTFMQEGVVVEIGEKSVSYWSWDSRGPAYKMQTYIKIKPADGGRKRHITRIDRVTVVS